MTRRHGLGGAVGGAALALALAALGPRLVAAQGGLTRESVSSTNQQASDASDAQAISADGRWLVFVSRAANLVAGDTNAAQDVFVRDLQLGVTTRASLASAGTEANGHSHEPVVSADGRFVAFLSWADNLVPGDTNGERDVFVHERATGRTTRVSVATGDRQGSAGPSRPAISADGRFVAFASDSALVAGDTNDAGDIFVHDRQTGVTTRVSVGANGAQANAPSAGAFLSADGRWVLFESSASNLVAQDTNGAADVFLHDRGTGETTRVSVGPGGLQSPRLSQSAGMSADARWIVFSTSGDLFFGGDTNGAADVFVHDRVAHTTARVSLAPGGGEANGDSTGVSISPDGRWIGFFSEAANLAAGDGNGAADVFVHDRQAGTTTLVSRTPAGLAATGRSVGGWLAADGRTAFASTAADLVANDTNGASDVFLHAPSSGSCGLALSSAQATSAAAAGSAVVHVVAAAPCAWSAASSAPTWLSVVAGATGTGAGEVTYGVTANGGPTRSAHLLIGGQMLVVDQPGVATPGAPTRLTVQSVVGHRVTLRWTAPGAGPQPTGYVIEGGLNPGETTAGLVTGSTAQVFAFDAPAGTFYARVHALNGAERSGASNEIRLHVLVPMPPSPPADLLASVDGAHVTFTWTNTFAGGAPAGVLLEVAGTAAGTLPLGPTDHVAFGAVPPGTYRVAVRAQNAAGLSERSNTIAVTVPAACVGPPPTPIDVRTSHVNGLASVGWQPDPTGHAPAAYVVIVTGAGVAAVPTLERTLVGQVAPGAYAISVVAVNSCGVSAGSVPQPLVVP